MKRMKKSILMMFAIATLLLNSCSNSHSQSAGYNLTIIEFAGKIKEFPTAPIVDVRTPEEFAKGHVQNAKNIDWNGNDFDKQIAKIDKAKPVFVYCLSGGRSGSAARKMRLEGYQKVYEMDGGIMKWRAANLPETTNEATTSAGMSKQQFDELLNTDKLVLIDFYADWCEPCTRMKPYWDKIANEKKESVKIIRINADDNQQLCKLLKIDALPVLQLYKSKKLTWNNTGFISKEDILSQLE